MNDLKSPEMPGFTRPSLACLFGVLLLPLAGLFSPPVLADQCEQLPKPAVVVQRFDDSISFNSQYSYKSLTNIGSALARPGKQVLGLTRGNASVKFAVNIPSYIDPTGRWECAAPQITLTYGFSPITVYVAREFPEGGCAYKEILDHERRHVTAYRTHIASLEKTLTDTLNARFATGAPWRGAVGKSHATVQKELDERWIPFVQHEIQRVDAAQAQIDTAEEYERVANSCAGEIRRVIR